MRKVNGVLVGLAALGALATAFASPAYGLCDGSATISDALRDGDVVFIGTVVETRTDNRSALFAVSDVWAGGPVRTWQPVLVPNELGNVNIFEETRWEDGTTYLVVARHRGADQLTSVHCSASQPLSDTVLAARPTGATEPIQSDRPLLWAWRPVLRVVWPVVLFAGAMATLLVVGRLARWPRPAG